MGAPLSVATTSSRRLSTSVDLKARLDDPAFRGANGQFDRQQFEYVLRQIGMRPEDFTILYQDTAAANWDMGSCGSQTTFNSGRAILAAGAGMLVPHIEGHDAGTLLELGVRSFAMYDDFVAGVAADAATSIEYRQVGSMEFATDPERHAWLRTEVERPRAGPRVWHRSC